MAVKTSVSAGPPNHSSCHCRSIVTRHLFRFIQPIRCYNLLSQPHDVVLVHSFAVYSFNLAESSCNYRMHKSATIPYQPKTDELTSSRLLGFSNPLACSSLSTCIPGPVLSSAVGLLPTNPAEAEGSWPRSEGLLVLAGCGWMVNSMMGRGQRGRKTQGRSGPTYAVRYLRASCCQAILCGNTGRSQECYRLVDVCRGRRRRLANRHLSGASASKDDIIKSRVEFESGELRRAVRLIRRCEDVQLDVLTLRGDGNSKSDQTSVDWISNVVGVHRAKKVARWVHGPV